MIKYRVDPDDKNWPREVEYPDHGAARAQRRDSLKAFKDQQNAKRIAADIERRRASRPAFKNALIAIRGRLH